MQILNTAEFLSKSIMGKIIDVRSPAEYASGHITNAWSLPMFTDEERSIVGTIYKQTGKKEAVLKGLEIIGKKLKNIAENALSISDGKPLYIHCWRGGMRSKSMAQLFENIGIECFILHGGYKSYRYFILEEFKKPRKFIVIGGKTGSGKTQVLHKLKAIGEQVIDLEKLANHKGSAFGSIGEQPQPSTEQFANDLFQNLSLLNPEKRIWLEDESQKIGTVFISTEFYNNYRLSPLILLDISFETRLQNLVNIYGKYNKTEIIDAFKKINKKLGGQNVQAAAEYVTQNNLKDAAAIALSYYDKTYNYGLQNKESNNILNLSFENEDSAHIAKKLIDTANERIG